MHAIVTTVWRNKYKSVCVCVCVFVGGEGGGGGGEERERRVLGIEWRLSVGTCIGFWNAYTRQSRPHPTPTARKALRISHVARVLGWETFVDLPTRSSSVVKSVLRWPRVPTSVSVSVSKKI